MTRKNEVQQVRAVIFMGNKGYPLGILSFPPLMGRLVYRMYQLLKFFLYIVLAMVFLGWEPWKML